MVINIGTLNERTMQQCSKAKRLSIRGMINRHRGIVRTDTTFKLLKVKFVVIRGNVSEIKTISRGREQQSVDADVSDIITDENLDEAIAFVKIKRTNRV